MTEPVAPVTEMGIELELCPRCGGPAWVLLTDVVYEVWCRTDSCLRLPARATEADAIAAWNTRALSTRTPKAVQVGRPVKRHASGSPRPVVEPWPDDVATLIRLDREGKRPMTEAETQAALEQVEILREALE